jgi:thioredoxin 1
MRSVMLVALAVSLFACADVRPTEDEVEELGAAFTVPEDAPSSFREAVSRARTGGKPLVIDFWASWCGPCKKLKRETLESPLVAPRLAQVEFVSIDVDAEPALAKSYGVAAIPLVLFVDAGGRVVDCLKGFEPPEPFLARLEKTLASSSDPAGR